MTPEENQILLKDLCARLPYGVLGHLSSDDAQFPDKELDVVTITSVDANPPAVEFVTLLGNYGVTTLDNIKPYLRPMSSMTEEEKGNLQSLHNIISDENYGDGYSPSAWDAITEWEDYCNSRHLDYRRLIEKGLALEAPEDMYKTK